jgi:hypothetical protein
MQPSATMKRVADDERPGGSAGCDVCGVLIDAAKAGVHDAWHRLEKERFEDLTRAVRELTDVVRLARH